ncbi:MAG: hypothetical protein AAF127_04490 [Pseudomonadota bacterium]
MSSRAFPDHAALSALAVLLIASPLRAQDDGVVTQEAESEASVAADSESQPDPEQEPDEPLRIDLSVTVPRGDVNEAQAQQCADEADAGSISGEIIVCRRIGEDGSNYASGSRAKAQKRFAEETAFKGAPRAPGTFGIPNHGNSIGIGGVPQPALIIDVEALPQAPPGSDADRISRGLPPLGQDEELSEEEIRERREALGLPPPSFNKKKPK